MAWGEHRTGTCPSGQVVTIRLFAMSDLIRRKVLPLNLIPSPVVSKNGSTPPADVTDDQLERLDVMRPIIEAGVVSPVIGKDVPWEEITDKDRTFLFTVLTDWQKEIGGMPADAGTFPDAVSRPAG